MMHHSKKLEKEEWRSQQGQCFRAAASIQGPCWPVVQNQLFRKGRNERQQSGLKVDNTDLWVHHLDPELKHLGKY